MYRRHILCTLLCMALLISKLFWRAQKSLNFQGPHLPKALLIDLALIKIIYVLLYINNRYIYSYSINHVVDPDPYVFGPPGSASGSVCHKYVSGSGPFHHQAKIVRKSLISTVL